jgi:hypothetical protein
MCETVRCARMRNSLEKWTNEMHADDFFPPNFSPLQCFVMLIFISNFLCAMCWTVCGYLCLPCARETSLLETAAAAQFWRYCTGLQRLHHPRLRQRDSV